MVSVSSETVVPAEGEHLTNGWDSAVAVEDTLIRRAAHVQASWPITLARATGRPWRHTDAWAGAFLAERGELSNPVVLLRPPTDLASLVAEIDDIVPTTSTYFLLSPWLHVDLSPHGLVLLGHPPLMVRFPGSAVPRLRADVDLHEVHTVEELVLAERVLVEGYPMPHLQPLTPGDLWPISVLSEKTRIWLAYVDGEPAATAAAHLGRRCHPGGVRRHTPRRARPGRRHRGDVGRHGRRPWETCGSGRQRRRPSGLRGAWLRRDRAVDRLASSRRASLTRDLLTSAPSRAAWHPAAWVGGERDTAAVAAR